MKYIAVFLLFVSSICFANQIPDHALTPGRVDNRVTKDVLCSANYLPTHSNIPAEVRAKVMKRYNLAPSAQVDIDNLVSVEVGGSYTDIRNLWPQDVCPASTAGRTCFGIQEKNIVEASLYRKICTNQISMANAQQLVRSGKWVEEYKNLMSEPALTH